jgi:hypothetical protein
MSENNLEDRVKICQNTVIFIVYMFMTCSTSYCLVNLKDLWNVYMYVCMYVLPSLKFYTENLIFLPKF